MKFAGRHISSFQILRLSVLSREELTVFSNLAINKLISYVKNIHITNLTEYNSLPFGDGQT